MRRSNPPTLANGGHLTLFCARGGEFDRQGRSRAGELTFTRAGWENLNRKCHVSNDVFLPGAEVGNSACMDEME